MNSVYEGGSSPKLDRECSHPLYCVNCKFFSRADSPVGDSRPIERAVEARTGSEDGLGSMVRCLQFAHTYIANRK